MPAELKECNDSHFMTVAPANLGQMGGVRVKTHEMYDKSTYSDGLLL